MDMYAENNGFQVLEGASPFEESSQFQGDGYTELPCQEPAETVWYGEADGTEGLPAGPYQETVMGTAGYGNTYGAEYFSVAPYQEQAAGYGTEVYMEETDALPVGPGQMPIQETEGLGMYQDTAPEIGEAVLMQADMPSMEGAISEAVQETAELEMEELETAELESTDSEMEEPETTEAGTQVAEASTAPDAEREDDEETGRTEHETAEARRKAEWEEKQQAKKAAEQEKLERIAEMSDDAAAAAAVKQVGADTEKLTRRNMKDCVAEYIQTLCLEDPGFARMVMHPRKNMIRCFRYINRKAREYVKQEMEDNDIKPENGVYGSDVPDDLCYQWAEDYFRDPDAEEDWEKEEKFVPKPYTGKAGSKAKAKKVAEKKTVAQKTSAKKPEKPGQEDDGQMSFPGQMSLSDIMAPEVKAG